MLTTENLFVYDGWNLVKEITKTGGVPSDKFYVWGLDLSQSLQGAGGIGGLLCAVHGGEVRRFFYDGNGNVGQVADDSGNIVARYEYDPFGNAVKAVGDYAYDNPFRFSTKYFDEETGLYYYGFRYYWAELGRWWSRDPLGEEGSVSMRAIGIMEDPIKYNLSNAFLINITDNSEGSNLYVYCGNNTFIFIDSVGLETIIIQNIFKGIAHGSRTNADIHAIVVHQTGSSTAESTLSSYASSDNGAHFLVAKDGCIYQTANLTDITWHVGKIKSKCWEKGTCSKNEKKIIKGILHKKGLTYTKKVKNLNDHESKKSYPDRYPMNKDSVGIEFVGEIDSSDKYVSLTKKQIEATKFLIDKLKKDLGLSDSDIYRHPDVSYKTESEASSVSW